MAIQDITVRICVRRTSIATAAIWWAVKLSFLPTSWRVWIANVGLACMQLRVGAGRWRPIGLRIKGKAVGGVA